jgi:hypothetical protein
MLLNKVVGVLLLTVDALGTVKRRISDEKYDTIIGRIYYSSLFSGGVCFMVD